MALLVQIARLSEGGAGGVGNVGDGSGDATVARPRAGDHVLHEAPRELAYSSLSIKQIAAELGFDDDAYIGRFFKKQTGHRPTAFRALARRRLAVAHGVAGQGRQPV